MTRIVRNRRPYMYGGEDESDNLYPLPYSNHRLFFSFIIIFIKNYVPCTVCGVCTPLYRCYYHFVFGRCFNIIDTPHVHLCCMGATFCCLNHLNLRYVDFLANYEKIKTQQQPKIIFSPYIQLILMNLIKMFFEVSPNSDFFSWCFV